MILIYLLVIVLLLAVGARLAVRRGRRSPAEPAEVPDRLGVVDGWRERAAALVARCCARWAYPPTWYRTSAANRWRWATGSS